MNHRRWALLAAVAFWFGVSCERTSHSASENNEVQVLQSMAGYQRFSQKLWFAGQAGNWELAEFYAHEIEEVTEELIDNQVFHDGRNLSKLAEKMFESQVKDLDLSIETEDETLFIKNYEALISACNACHTTTGHEVIVINKPVINPYNQVF